MTNSITEKTNTTLEDIQRESIAREIDRIFYITPVDFVDYELLDVLYKKSAGRGNGFHGFGLASVYLMGYIYGVRAERKKRKVEQIVRIMDRVQMIINRLEMLYWKLIFKEPSG
jgi:transposase